MTPRYLLDTNVLSEPLRERPDPAVLRHLSDREGELATASTVWHELVYGVSRLSASRKRVGLERYLQEVVAASIPILPYDGAAAEWHAEARARLSALGRPPSFADGQIAAVAKVNDLTLVTNNVVDFDRFEGLSLERWHGK